jgi:dGTPase
MQRKTQVFINPRNTHIRTREAHTEEVEAYAVIVACLLGVNVELVRAIASGHDSAHAPFGHLGEYGITKFSGKSFRHEVFACNMFQNIERLGKGLNLRYETLHGILRHSRGSGQMQTFFDEPQENTLMMFADKTVYTFADINDYARVGRNIEEELPIVNFFGKTQRERINTCIKAIVKESAELGCVSFEKSEVAQNFAELRKGMYEIYPNHNQLTQALRIMEGVYELISTHERFKGCAPEVVMALLNDQDMFDLSDYAACPYGQGDWIFDQLDVMEIVPFIRDREIDITDPCLDWAT